MNRKPGTLFFFTPFDANDSQPEGWYYVPKDGSDPCGPYASETFARSALANDKRTAKARKIAAKTTFDPATARSYVQGKDACMDLPTWDPTDKRADECAVQSFRDNLACEDDPGSYPFDALCLAAGLLKRHGEPELAEYLLDIRIASPLLRLPKYLYPSDGIFHEPTPKRKAAPK